MKDVESRTLFVAGFSRFFTQDELINFFDKNFEGVCNMRMRRRERDPERDDVSMFCDSFSKIYLLLKHFHLISGKLSPSFHRVLLRDLGDPRRRSKAL